MFQKSLIICCPAVAVDTSEVKRLNHAPQILQNVQISPNIFTIGGNSMIINEPQSFQHKSTSKITSHLLPGIKLPKTKQQWEEANAYFHHKLNDLNNIEDIDSYALLLQNTIYQYFADTYGILKPKESTVVNVNADHRKLKKKLKNLKILGQNDNSFIDEIKCLSKLIRLKIHREKISKAVGQSKISVQLSKNFWNTCKKLFSLSTPLPPLFDVDKGADHFGGVMKAGDRTHFAIPDWIPPLQPPVFNGTIDPPTYEEVSSIVRRSKSSASPCPLDQISTIMFKKCPILRTYLHKLLSKCWVASTIPGKPLHMEGELYEKRLLTTDEMLTG
ncbi:hypothetical protein HELRODRAFT_171815 [Helobdella robusta]|uniref:Uncharacterized protein n=1 Tax=Helobdella robusta TaxID=6412 RepID=T1F4Q6_HELRO|nr:hypothetical protein HELRODRAFT_171815 [Helobdella robusta]ESO05416.1 hypothetical protein HELRODRAFT_171815 [Helobdella robusta]